MLPVFVLIFTHAVMKVGKIRNHLFVRFVEIGQVMPISLNDLPMNYPVNGTIEEWRLLLQERYDFRFDHEI